MKLARPWTATLVLVVVAGVSLMAQTPNQEAIPFRFGRSIRVILIQGEVNGNLTSFLVDTGSNRTIVSSKFIQGNSQSVTVVVPADGSGHVARGAYTTASLKVGRRAWRSPQIVVMDLQDLSKGIGEEVGGLLGMDFLNEFKTVVVDLRQHKLILEP